MWRLPGPVLPGAPGSVFTVAFGPGTSDLAVATAPPGGPGAVQLWDTAAPGQPVPLGPLLVSSAGLDGTVGYGPGGRLAAGGGKGGIALWDVQDPRHPRALPPPSTSLDTAIQYVVFDRTGRLMAAAGSDGRIELWNTADFARARPLAVLPGDDVPQDEQAIYALAFAPGDRLLASAGADGTVALWDISHPSHPRRRLPSQLQPRRPHPGGLGRGRQGAPVGHHQPGLASPAEHAERAGRHRIRRGLQP